MKKILIAVFATAFVAWVLTNTQLRGDDDKTATSAPAVAKTGALVVWDGETKSNAQCWAGGAIKVQGQVVHAGKQGLAWTAKGARCHNGWNWFGWHPADGGTDISAYANLVFWIKVAGATKPAELWVDLVSNNSGKSTPTLQVGIAKYCPKAFDGEWHEVVVPLKDLYGDQKDFDSKKVWELDISASWDDSVYDFVAYLDDLGFSGADAAAGPAAVVPAPVVVADVSKVTWAAKPSPRPDKWWMDRHAEYVALAKKGNIDLYFDGDSITDMWHGSAAGVWNKAFAGWNAANFGMGGDLTPHALWRLQNGEFAGVKPKVVVLMIGTNNIGGPDGNGDTIENIAAGVTALVREVQKQSPTSKILLLGIFPRGEKATDHGRVRAQAVNELLAKLDDGKTVKYMDIGAKFLEADGTLPKSLFSDSVHPTPKGYQIWADAIKPQLTEWLGTPAAVPATK
jgi:lysophospholipase L1-like esterase